MNFINWEKEYAKDFKTYVVPSDYDALENIIPDYILDGIEHEMDNHFIDTSFGKTIHEMRLDGYQILGIGKAPRISGDRDMALVFENIDTFEKCWCHVSQLLINWWLEQIRYGKAY